MIRHTLDHAFFNFTDVYKWFYEYNFIEIMYFTFLFFAILTFALLYFRPKKFSLKRHIIVEIFFQKYLYLKKYTKGPTRRSPYRQEVAFLGWCILLLPYIVTLYFRHFSDNYILHATNVADISLIGEVHKRQTAVLYKKLPIEKMMHVVPSVEKDQTILFHRGIVK